MVAPEIRLAGIMIKRGLDEAAGTIIAELVTQASIPLPKAFSRLLEQITGVNNMIDVDNGFDLDRVDAGIIAALALLDELVKRCADHPIRFALDNQLRLQLTALLERIAIARTHLPGEARLAAIAEPDRGHWN